MILMLDFWINLVNVKVEEKDDFILEIIIKMMLFIKELRL